MYVCRSGIGLEDKHDKVGGNNVNFIHVDVIVVPSTIKSEFKKMVLNRIMAFHPPPHNKTSLALSIKRVLMNTGIGTKDLSSILGH